MIALGMPGAAELIIVFLICIAPLVIAGVIVIVIFNNKKANTDAEETVDTTPSEQTNDHFSETDA
jgi:hypothetical protein